MEIKHLTPTNPPNEANSPNGYPTRSGGIIDCSAYTKRFMCDNSPDTNAKQEMRELWTMVRSAIEHEDTLVNHRITWVITAHAFLLAAFGAIQSGLLPKFDTPNMLPSILCAQVGLGFLFYTLIRLARNAMRAVLCAHEHMRHLKEWWFNRFESEKYPDSSMPELGLFPSRAATDQVAISAKALKIQLPPIKGNFAVPAEHSVNHLPVILIFLDFVVISWCFATASVLGMKFAEQQGLLLQGLITAAIVTGLCILFAKVRESIAVTRRRWLLLLLLICTFIVSFLSAIALLYHLRP